MERLFLALAPGQATEAPATFVAPLRVVVGGGARPAGLEPGPALVTAVREIGDMDGVPPESAADIRQMLDFLGSAQRGIVR